MRFGSPKLHGFLAVVSFDNDLSVMRARLPNFGQVCFVWINDTSFWLPVLMKIGLHRAISIAVALYYLIFRACVPTRRNTTKSSTDRSMKLSFHVYLRACAPYHVSAREGSVAGSRDFAFKRVTVWLWLISFGE